MKVALFHGYAIQKRIEAVDDHFTVRGWFDIYCTQGPSSTPYFKELEKKYGFFRVYETGWPKADTYFSPEVQRKPQNDHPVILYPPTFNVLRRRTRTSYSMRVPTRCRFCSRPT